MKNYLLISTLLCFIVIKLDAQENFIKGGILTLHNDSMSGMIDYRDRELNPSTITFQNASGEIKTYKAGEINAFWAGKDAVFLSKHLSMDISNFRLQDLLVNDSAMIVKDTAVFVRLLVGGPLNLYYLKDENEKEHFWFQKGNDSIFEMRIVRKMVKTQGASLSSERSLATLNLYQLILPGIVEGCPDLQTQAKTISFSKPAFTKFAIQYHDCIGKDKPVFVAKQKQVKVTFGLVAGASVISLKFHTYDDMPITKASFPSVWTYTGGVALKIILPYLNGSWIIYNDLVFRPYHVTGSYDESDPTFPAISNHYTYDFNMAYIKLNTMLRYQFPKWQVKPFVNIGMSNSFAVQNTNSYTFSSNTKPKPTYEEGAAVPETKTYEAGFIGGIGVVFKGLGLEARYEWANGMSSYMTLTCSETSVTFLLSYTFGQK